MEQARGKLDPHGPRHVRARWTLRVLGAAFLVGACVLGVVGLFDLFAANRPFGEPPRGMLYIFLSMPIVFVGLALTSLGWGAALARYQARELGPVGVETTNYIAEGVEPAVRGVARAIGAGLSEGSLLEHRKCEHCQGTSAADARFCDDCGRPFPASGAESSSQA